MTPAPDPTPRPGAAQRGGARPEGTVLPAPATAPPVDPIVGQTIARCRVEARIGEGHTSVVYRATHGALGMPVAVKVLKPAVVAVPALVAKFENEARAIARLDHPNILKIFDVAAEGDRHAIVIELLEGESVLELLAREVRLSPIDSLRIVRQAASGLAAAHAKGIVHRDVKPQNLVILADGTVKLVDFGLATETGGEESTARIGTPQYMAPEVCEAKPVVPTSDVYSLGITLYHLLVGSPPYAGQGIRETLFAHMAAETLHPERRLPGLPVAICDLVREMTKRDPLTRPSAAEVVQETDRIGGKELAARPRLEVGRNRRGRRRSSRGPVLLIGAVLVAAVGVAVVLASRGRGGNDSGTTPGGVEANAGRTGPPRPTVPADAVPAPAPPPPSPPAGETEAQKRLRLQAEHEDAGRRAAVALGEAEVFARAHWRDKDAVVGRYRAVAKQYPDTLAGKDATTWASEIEAGTRHPHPDRKIEAVVKDDPTKAAWAAAQPRYEEALSRMRYGDAAGLVPDPALSKDDAQVQDLRFWKALADDCRAFLDDVAGAIERAKPGSLSVVTAKGPAVVSGRTPKGLRVQLKGAPADVEWADIAPAEVLALASSALADEGDALAARRASFAFAHRVRKEFFAAAMPFATGASESTQVAREIQTAEARFGGK